MALAMQATPTILALNPFCLQDYRNYLNREQVALNQALPKLHEKIQQLTGKYNSCLAKESRKPTGKINPCGSSHLRLVDSQNRLQAHTHEMNLIQADLALMTRNPQQALSTLPCTSRWRKASRAGAFSSPCPCR